MSVALHVQEWESLPGFAGAQAGGPNLGRRGSVAVCDADRYCWLNQPSEQGTHTRNSKYDRSKEFRERASLPSFAE
eukprot:931300-Prymnesium_polylepis.1